MGVTDRILALPMLVLYARGYAVGVRFDAAASRRLSTGEQTVSIYEAEACKGEHRFIGRARSVARAIWSVVWQVIRRDRAELKA